MILGITLLTLDFTLEVTNRLLETHWVHRGYPTGHRIVHR